jgi:lipopolysaccharide/colanic/teichoic acid biosynthesis glycosyltransferase
MEKVRMKNFQLCVKRVFDIVASALLILILIAIPVLIIVPIGIKLTSKGPAVFVQDRVGKNGKIFKIYKFRTMDLPPEDSYVKDGVLYQANGELLKSETRINKFGAFLRKTSLDELMQLFNILNGTMSFVGPRPTLPYQVEQYSEEQRRRMEMRPGVTGWAQVNGRNDLTWTEKIKLDIQYIDHFNLWFDTKILFMTVGTVIGGKGVAFNKYDDLTARKK